VNNAAVEMQSEENLVKSSSCMDGEERLYICFVIQEETINVDIFLTRRAQNKVQVEE